MKITKMNFTRDIHDASGCTMYNKDVAEWMGEPQREHDSSQPVTIEYVGALNPVWPCPLMTFCDRDETGTVLTQEIRYEFGETRLGVKRPKLLEKMDYRCSICLAKKLLFKHKAAPDKSKEHLQEIFRTIRPYQIFQSQAEGNGNETESFLAKIKSLLMEQETAGHCECAWLLKTKLFPRVQTCRTKSIPKRFYYLLESIDACARLQNDGEALAYLYEARSILENRKERVAIYFSAENVHIFELQYAFLYRLKGEILFKIGKIVEAEESFKKSFNTLNCSFPENSVAQSWKLMREKRKERSYQAIQFEIPDKTKLCRLQESIYCLSYLWQIGCMRGQLKRASLAITMEINLAIESGEPFNILYTAIDYLKYSQLQGKESNCRHLEAFLCRTCASLSDQPAGQRLISHLTQTLAVIKLYTGDLEQSIECTTQVQQLNEILNRPGLDVRAKAASHLLLLLTDRYKESVQQILTLETLSNELLSSVAKGWFYAACMNFLLYAGFAFRPYKECLSFVEESPLDAIQEAEKSLVLYLYSAMALWYARLADWEKSAVYFDKANEVYAQIPASVESISGVVMLLECSILFFRKDLTECNFQRRTTLRRTQKLFSDVTQQFGTNHVFAPRVLHLNAYLHLMTGSETLVQDLLNQALLLCEKQGNLLDQAWIRQSQADWSGVCSDTPAEWSTAVQSMPSWDEAAILQPEQLLKYRVHLQKVEVSLH